MDINALYVSQKSSYHLGYLNNFERQQHNGTSDAENCPQKKRRGALKTATKSRQERVYIKRRVNIISTFPLRFLALNGNLTPIGIVRLIKTTEHLPNASPAHRNLHGRARELSPW